MPNIPTEGTFGAPPPGAPQEVTQDLKPDLLAEQLARARSNERELPPLTFSPGVPAPIQPPTPLPAPTGAATPAAVESTAPPSGIVLTDAPNTLAEAVAHRTGSALIQGHQPAASNTDSPSRGIPKPVTDPGKVITGGFGHAMEAQYFPLDGLELRKLTEQLLDQMREQIQNDLHFTVAICYPRVAVRLILEVSGYTQDEGFRIQKGVAHEKTPEDVATAAGTPFQNVLVEQRREFDENNEPVDPPDRIRDSLGLRKPHKQQIETGGGKMIVDVPTTIDGSF